MVAGQLEILLLANVARLRQDMDQAKQVVTGAMDKVEAAVGKAKVALGALGLGVSVGALANMAKGFVDAAAKLDDMAEKTGASVEELSKLQQQARISGESMETVEMGLIRLSKALHNTDDESKGAGKALAAVGLKAEDLRNLDTAQALRKVAEAFNQYADGSGKTAAALDIFGKSGAALLPILKDMATEGTLNASVTAKQAAEAEELQKTLRRLANASEVAKQQLVLEFVPGMQRLLTTMIETNKATGSFVQSIGGIASINLGRFGDTTAGQLRQINAELELTAKWQGILGSRALSLSPLALFGKAVGGIELSQLVAAREAALVIQRVQALALTGGDTPGEMQRFKLPGFVKGQVPHSNAGGGGKVDNEALRIMEKYEAQLAKIAEEMRKIDGIDSPFLAMQALLKSDKDLAKLEPALKTRLLDLAEELGIQKALRQEEKEREEGLAKVAEESQAWRSKDIADMAALRDKYIELVDPLEAVRKEHEKIRQLVEGKWLTEAQGKLAMLPSNVRGLLQPESNVFNDIQQAWERGLLDDDQMQKALARATEHTKVAADEITEFWRQAARNMQDAMSTFFFDIMQGKFDNLGSGFKRMIDKMVADAIAAKLADALFGDKAGGGMGGLVGKLFGGFGGDLFGGGGFGGGEAMGFTGDDFFPAGEFGGFAHGGSFRVGGHGGTDSQLVAFRASPDERVTVETPGQQGRGKFQIVVNNNYHGRVDRGTVDQASVATGRAVQRALERNT